MHLGKFARDSDTVRIIISQLDVKKLNASTSDFSRTPLLTAEAAECDRSLCALKVEHFNPAIYIWSGDQIYAPDISCLGDLVTLPKSPTI